MAPQPDNAITRQAQVNAGIAQLAAEQAALIWANIDWESPSARGTVRALYGAVVEKFGQAAASVAATFYDEMRAAAGVESAYTAEVAAGIPAELLDNLIDSAFSVPGVPVEQAVPAKLGDALQRLVLQPGRDTIAMNAAQDPAKPRFIRVPQGDKSCAFCVMLASRELSANFKGYKSSAVLTGSGTKYHNWCDCESAPVFPGADLAVLSPRLGEYYKMYHEATVDAGTHGVTKKILASMRSLHGLK